MYFVYILTNHKNTVLYIGMTNNLQRRVLEHKSNLVEGFTSRYRLHKLVWAEEFPTAIEAINVEKKLKGWKRNKKDALIKETNPNWNDLAIEVI